MTLSSIESVFSFVKNDGRQLPYEVSSIGCFCQNGVYGDTIYNEHSLFFDEWARRIHLSQIIRYYKHSSKRWI